MLTLQVKAWQSVGSNEKSGSCLEDKSLPGEHSEADWVWAVGRSNRNGMRSSGRLCISMQILEEAAYYMYAKIQICSVVCSSCNARSEPNFLSSENLVKEVKADSCSPLNSLMEELWK